MEPGNPAATNRFMAVLALSKQLGGALMFRVICAGLVAAASTVLAADSGVTRKLFDRMDVPAGYEAVVGSAELPAGASIGRHSHRIRLCRGWRT